MKKHTRILALLLVLAMVFSLAACQSKQTRPESTTAQPAETKAPAPETEPAPKTEPASDAEPAPDSEASQTDAPATEPVETEPPETEPPETEPPVEDGTLNGKYFAFVDYESLMAIAGQEIEEEELELYQQLFDGAGDMQMLFEFSEGDRYTFTVDPESVEDMIETMFENLAVVLPAMFGMEAEELEAMLAAQGMTMDDFVAAMREEMSGDEFIDAEEMHSEGTYRLDGDRLYITPDGEEENTENYVTVVVGEGYFAITEIVGEGSDMAAYDKLLPWVFIREDGELPRNEDGKSLGKYAAPISIQTLMGAVEGGEEEMEAYGQLFEGAEDMIMFFEFFEDNKVRFSIDPDSAKALMETMVRNLPTVLPAMMGMSDEEFEEYLTASGMTMDDFVAAVSEALSPEDLLDTDEMGAEGTYRLDGDKLYITAEGEEENTDSYMIVEFTDDTFTIKEMVGDQEGMEEYEALLPWTFTRVD